MLGPLYENSLVAESISIYRQMDVSLTINTHFFPGAVRDRGFTEVGEHVSWEQFDPGSPDAIISAITARDVGYDILVCHPHVQALNKSVIEAGVKEGLAHRLAFIAIPNDSPRHLQSIRDIAASNGIQIITSSRAHSGAVAEYTLGQMISLQRRLEHFRDCTGAEPPVWRHEEALLTTGSLAGKTLGILGGSGRDGSAVIRLASNMGLTVLSLAPRSMEGFKAIEEAGASVVAELIDLLPQCDFLSLNCRLCDDTVGVIGSSEIRAMKRGVFIVNPAGAELFDRQALLDEFAKPADERMIAALVLDLPWGGIYRSDVFVCDPINAALRRAGVQFTPRMAGYTVDSQRRADREVASRLAELLVVPPL